MPIQPSPTLESKRRSMSSEANTSLSVSECASNSSSRSLQDDALSLTSPSSSRPWPRPRVDAARRNIFFLRYIAESDWLHRTPVLLEALRRYHELWMPLISDLTVDGKPPMILPPIDVEWLWFCHSLNPVHYRNYCNSRFSKLIPKPAIFDQENEDYAFNRCRDIWTSRFPNDPFDNTVSDSWPSSHDNPPSSFVSMTDFLLPQALKLRYLYSLFSQPYVLQLVYLIASQRRYNKFLSLLHRISHDNSSFSLTSLLPASDILLMWVSHMSYPGSYAADTKHLDKEMTKVIGPWHPVTQEDVDKTKQLWEINFDQPYEKAGGIVAVDLEVQCVLPDPEHNNPVYWVSSDAEDANSNYKSMHPRFLLEVCVYVRLLSEVNANLGSKTDEFLRLGMLKCHRHLKLHRAISTFPSNTWQKVFHLYCEYGTKGVLLELRHAGGSLCLKGTGLLENASVSWNELLRLPSLSAGVVLDQRMRAFTSITPPVQAPYLLKCVPDRVTDDSGAMISDVILQLNKYRPQEGRWLSRTVLDHAGRECFVIRIRVGGGFWRRGGESPETVKWEDRIIEVREGGWSYVADSIGRAPEKIVGKATPKEESLKECRATWCLSTGDELTIQGDPTLTTQLNLSFSLRNQNSSESVRLLNGRQMQYRKSKDSNGVKEDTEEVEEEGFVTVVRCSDENPNGKATALLNWKLLVAEFLPEEDAVFVLLLCLTILRSASEMRKEDLGKLLIRRRLKEPKLGSRDWGSVLLHPSSSSFLAPDSCSPHLQPWYWNPKAVFDNKVGDQTSKQPALLQSLAEGGDKLYKRGIIP